MQELKGFGLTLKLVDETTAEQVRLWRNEPSIAQFMEYKENITPEMQQIWLKNIQNSSDLFYVISQDKNLIGTIHLSQINSIQKTAEAGIFIGNKEFSGTGITLGASLLLLDLAFETLNLQRVFAKINIENKAAEQYNEILGFEKVKVLTNAFNLWAIEKRKYLGKRDGLRKLV